MFNEYDKFYSGKTSRPSTRIIKQHQSYKIRDREYYRSRICQHVFDNSHKIPWNNAMILVKEWSSKKPQIKKRFIQIFLITIAEHSYRNVKVIKEFVVSASLYQSVTKDVTKPVFFKTDIFEAKYSNGKVWKKCYSAQTANRSCRPGLLIRTSLFAFRIPMGEVYFPIRRCFFSLDWLTRWSLN